ncbi:MAG: hypothetical protein IPL61_32805 [Myxococcales bacterium]|nr:hypothetical protein [Myxococcales bacterium]
MAFGLSFDRRIVDHLTLVDDLLMTHLDSSRVIDLITHQTCMPLATRKLRKPGAFEWKRLKKTIEETEVIVVGLSSAPSGPDADHVELMLDLISSDTYDHVAPDRRLPYRFDGAFGLGARVLARCADVDVLVAGVFRDLVAELGLAVGVVVAAPTCREALGTARASGGMPGTSLFVRTGRLWGARWTWGPYAREPEWGTFLQRRHADAIGGPAAIRAAVEPFAVLEAGDVVFVQLTPYADELSPAAEAKRVALEALMQPILGAPSSRAP